MKKIMYMLVISSAVTTGMLNAFIGAGVEVQEPVYIQEPVYVERQPVYVEEQYVEEPAETIVYE